MGTFSKILKAYKLNSSIKFEQTFFCENAYNNRVSELRSLGFIIGDELVH